MSVDQLILRKNGQIRFLRITGAPKPKLIAITVKLDPALYRHLKQIGLQRTPATTMQQVVVDALIQQYGEPDE